VFVKIVPHPRTVAEIATLHLNFEEISDGSIMIYDRHYCDSLLLDRHLKSGKPCIIKMKTSEIKVVDFFLESGKSDDIVEFRIDANAPRSAKNKYGLKNKYPQFSKFKIRFIRIELSTGEIEVLATTLLDKKKDSESDFNYLYGKRWGDETAFDEIKNQLKLGIFSGYKTDFILHDLWSIFIFYNIRAIFLYT
jgi:hypothetical protein